MLPSLELPSHDLELIHACLPGQYGTCFVVGCIAVIGSCTATGMLALSSWRQWLLVPRKSFIEAKIGIEVIFHEFTCKGEVVMPYLLRYHFNACKESHWGWQNGHRGSNHNLPTFWMEGRRCFGFSWSNQWWKLVDNKEKSRSTSCFDIRLRVQRGHNTNWTCHVEDKDWRYRGSDCRGT